MGLAGFGFGPLFPTTLVLSGQRAPSIAGMASTLAVAADDVLLLFLNRLSTVLSSGGDGDGDGDGGEGEGGGAAGEPTPAAAAAAALLLQQGLLAEEAAGAAASRLYIEHAVVEAGEPAPAAAAAFFRT